MPETKPTFHSPPPWRPFPEHKRGSLFWKMGAGESFLLECLERRAEGFNTSGD